MWQDPPLDLETEELFFNDIKEKIIKNKEDAVEKYKELNNAFNNADDQKLKDFFGHDMYDYYFRSAPRLYMEKINRMRLEV